MTNLVFIIFIIFIMKAKNKKLIVIYATLEDKAYLQKYAKTERRNLSAFILNGMMKYIGTKKGLKND